LGGKSFDSSNHLRNLLQRPIPSPGEHPGGATVGTPVSTTKVWVPGTTGLIE